jgi:hypothetical protein
LGTTASTALGACAGGSAAAASIIVIHKVLANMDIAFL